MSKKRKPPPKLHSLDTLPLLEARSVLLQDAPMPAKSPTRMFLAELITEVLNGEDVRRHYFYSPELFGDDPRPLETAPQDFSLAVIWYLAERLAPAPRGQRTARMRELLDTALGSVSNKAKRPESRLERALASQGGKSTHTRPSGPAWKQVYLNDGLALRQVRREACGQFGVRGPAVDRWLRELAKKRPRKPKRSL